MIQITIFLVYLIAPSFEAPSPNGGSKCVVNRMKVATAAIPSGYQKQITKLLQCDGPKFYTDCYESNVGKVPRDFESLINASCSLPESKKLQKFNACVSESKSSALVAAQEYSKQTSCQMNVIQSGEEGFLCHQWKVVGAEKASEFAQVADSWFVQMERLLSDTAPQDLKSCAALLPKKSSDALSMLCDPDMKNGPGPKLTKCIEDNTTIRAVFEIVSKISPRFG